MVEAPLHTRGLGVALLSYFESLEQHRTSRGGAQAGLQDRLPDPRHARWLPLMRVRVFCKSRAADLGYSDIALALCLAPALGWLSLWPAGGFPAQVGRCAAKRRSWSRPAFRVVDGIDAVSGGSSMTNNNAENGWRPWMTVLGPVAANDREVSRCGCANGLPVISHR